MSKPLKLEQDAELFECIEYAANREELFRTALESLAEGILITDQLSRIIFANGRLEEITGYPRSEIIGLISYKLLLPPEEWPVAERRHKERLSGRQEEYDHQIRCKDGSLHWVRVRATPSVDRSGRVIGTMGALTSIQREKDLEETHATLLDELRGHDIQIIGEESPRFKKSWSDSGMLLPRMPPCWFWGSRVSARSLWPVRSMI